jgi:uncharacterized metal-binding protein YceD (DUF177 family)
MMIIDVRKLNAQKLYRGTLSFEYSAPEDLIGIPFVKFAEPVKVEVDYEIYEDDSVDLKGKIFYRLVGQCSRCLKDAETAVEGDLEAYFQPFTGGDDYAYSGGKICLNEAVEDAIMASMPFSLSCGDDCESIPFSSGN